LAVALTSGALGMAVNAVVVTAGLSPDSTEVTWAQVTATVIPVVLELLLVLTTGRSLGELVVRLRPVPRPGPVRATARWLCGIGGWWLLQQWDAWYTSLAAAVLTIGSVLAIWTTRQRRGFAAWVAGVDIVDERADACPRTPNAGTHTPG